MKKDHNLVLESHDLSIGFKNKKEVIPILENLNLQLCKGKLVCLMGENGAGKSTLLRTLAQFQPALSGKIALFGKQIHTISESVIAKTIAVVLTQKSAPEGITVEELVSLGRYPYLGSFASFSAEDEQKINTSIAQTGIENLRQRKLGTLSDGQLQKAYIARALCQDTEILLLDEPTTHLDLNNRIEIVMLVRRLAHKMGKAVLMATHEVDLALQVADLLWLVERTGSVQQGIPEDLIINGAADAVFPLKGYNLKTGRVQWQKPTNARGVYLTGTSSHLLLWTKNALERSGYILEEKVGKIQLKVEEKGDRVEWSIQNEGKHSTCYSIESMLEEMKN